MYLQVVKLWLLERHQQELLMQLMMSSVSPPETAESTYRDCHLFALHEGGKISGI